jgi:hypothetical protein
VRRELELTSFAAERERKRERESVCVTERERERERHTRKVSTFDRSDCSLELIFFSLVRSFFVRYAVRVSHSDPKKKKAAPAERVRASGTNILVPGDL